MTCFWDALLNKLRDEDLRNLLRGGPRTPRNLVLALKRENRQTTTVRWQGQALSPQQLTENVEWVQTHDVNTIQNGYDCSTADPYLLLVSWLLRVRIHHRYLRSDIVYAPDGPARYQIHLSSNRGHIS